MAKKVVWACRECGAEHAGWVGQCEACGQWDTVREEDRTPTAGKRGRVVISPSGRATAVAEVADDRGRSETGIGEVDRVLGGGFMPGSVVLLYGSPGIGKSTLLLQVAAGMADRGSSTVLYASGEESMAQVARRASRLGAVKDRLLLLAETRTEAIFETAHELVDQGSLGLLIVDSIQAVYSEALDGMPGHTGQIRAVCAQMISFAKQQGVPVVIVGQVNKEDRAAGPRILEHMVDAVVSFEGDENGLSRLLRADKNRFGSTAEVGVFEMSQKGLRAIDNPTEAFLSRRRADVSGSAVTVSLQGSRPIVLEIQALLADCGDRGTPRRTSVGVDTVRLGMLLAVLERHGGCPVLARDAYLNVAGGIRLSETAADLAVAIAAASSHLDESVPRNLIVMGEVGLTGELRPADRLELRLIEAARLGFRQVLSAPFDSNAVTVPKGLKVTKVATLPDALGKVFPHAHQTVVEAVG